ncbi:MAG: lipase family protein [Planctomycetes bacterium]|nr:lipase family protein [Planctomycetota bacterium]
MLSLLAAGHWYARAATPDRFYTVRRDSAAEPGALLALESFRRDVPASARAWRMLYSTTRSDNSPTVGSAIVLVARSLPPGPRPTLVWCHGTTGVVPGCAPSLLDRPFDCLPALDGIISQGWIYVAADYVGLGTAGPHPYLIGEGEARSTLDAVRAARRISELSFDDRSVVWGHSQGGHAALWTAILAPSHAPDVHIVGVAAFAPASDLIGLLAATADRPVGRIFSSFIVTAYAAAYPDVDFDDWVRPSARLVARDIASRCLAPPEALFSACEALLFLDGSIFARDPTTGTLGDRLRANVPRARFDAPLFVGQGERDDLVLPFVQERFVAELRALGQSVEYRTYEGHDHLSLVAVGSPVGVDVLAWTAACFTGGTLGQGAPNDAR